MTAIVRYLTSRYLFHLLLVLVALAALSLAFDLMEKGDQVLRADNGGVSALARYAGLRTPTSWHRCCLWPAFWAAW